MGLKGLADKSDRELSAIARTDDINFSKYLSNLVADLSPDVLHIQTDKTHGLNPGRFVIRLVNRKPYAKILQAHDLVLISLNEGERNSETISVMLGVIVRVTQPIRISNEQATHYIEVHGQDLARWLYVDRNFFYFYTGVGSDAKDGVLELKERDKLWRSLFPNQGQGELPSVKIIENILVDYIYRILPRVGEVIRWHPVETASTEAVYRNRERFLGFGELYVPKNDLAAYSGSVANLLEEHAMQYLSELWSDTTTSGGFQVYYRRRPFDQSDWMSFQPAGKALDQTKVLHVVPDRQILSSDIGKSDDEYYNFISILPWLYAADTSILPLVMKSALRLDISAIKNRGLRPLMVSSNYLDRLATTQDTSFIVFDDYNSLIQSGQFANSSVAARVPLSQVQAVVARTQHGKGHLVNIADDWASAMWRWYSQLDRYLNGRIVIKGTPSIRVGHIVELSCETKKAFSEPHRFYVMSVSHDYEVDSGRYLTTLGLGRGQPSETTRFIKPVTDGKTDIPELDADKRLGRLQNKQILKDEPFSPRDIQVEVSIERDLP